MGKIEESLLKEIWSITREEGGIADPSRHNAGFVAIYDRGIEGFSDEEISDHVKLLKDAGFIEARNIPSLDVVINGTQKRF